MLKTVWELGRERMAGGWCGGGSVREASVEQENPCRLRQVRGVWPSLPGEEGDRQIQDCRAGRARAVTVSGFSEWGK